MLPAGPRTNYAPRLSWQSIWIPKRTPLALHRFVPVFERSGAERVQAFTEVLQCVIRAAKAFGKYVAATQSMVDAVPSGTHLPVMGFGDGTGGPWLGNGEILIGREAYRIAELAGVP